MAFNVRVHMPWVTKLDRARELTAELDREVTAYLARGAISLETRSMAPTEWEFYLQVTRPPPLRWSSLVGDVLHNCRSALDTFACGVFESTGSLTADQLDRVQFPITSSVAAYDGHSWFAHRTPPESIERAFRPVQPWAVTDGLDLDEPTRQATIKVDPLSALRDLHNYDKHHTTHLIACAIEVIWGGLPDGVTGEWRNGDPWPWVNGSRIAAFVADDSLSASASPTFGHGFGVGLENDVGPLRVYPIAARLAGFCGAADRAIHLVRRSLAEPGGNP
jgi:hypothetical protein